MKSLVHRHLGLLRRRASWLAGPVRRLGAGRSGVTLLELAVATAIMGLVGAFVVGASGRSLSVSSTLGKDSRLSNQTRQTSFATTDDARYSQVFVPVSAAEKGTFESADFTVSPPATETVTYVLGANLAREVSVLGTGAEVVKTAQDVGAVADFSLSLVNGAIVTSVVVQSEVTAAERTATAVLTQAVEAPGPVVTATGVPPLPMPTVLCFGQSLSVRGSRKTVVGNAVVKGTVTVSGSDNVFAGDLTAGSVVVSGNDNSFDAVWKGTAGSCGFTLSPASFAPYDFVFTGDTKLENKAEVWEDQSKGRLKPGVYVVDGTLALSGDEVSGEVTFIARRIVLSGSKTMLSARRNGVLMLAAGGVDPEAIRISGAKHVLVGVMYAQQGDIRLGGSESIFDGAYLSPNGGADFELAGSDSSILFNQPMFDAAAAVRQDSGG